MPNGRLRTLISVLAATAWLAACASLAISAPGSLAPVSPSVQPGEQTSLSPTEHSSTLYVFAAASLTEAFEGFARSFEASHPGVRVVLNFAGSQQLAQQIIQGAPADVFASANQRQMDAVITDGRIAAGSEQPFVKNRLVVIVPQDNPAGIETIQDLAGADLRLVLAAKEVPAGQYTLEFLDKASRGDAAYKQAVLANVVSYEDNVKAVVSKVALGEADAGVVYVSDISGENASRVAQIEIPANLNVIATYPIAPIHDSVSADLARAFIAAVLSPEGQRSLEKSGFILVK